MIVSAIMPIKLHNERLPGKNTKLLGNKPLLHYQLEALKKTGLYTNITVFCSDEAIVPFLPDGVEFLKRSPELDSPSSNFSQIFTSYISLVDADVYLYAHVTAPFVTVATIKTCINAVTSGAYDSAFCASKIQDFLWRNGKPLNFDAKNMPRSQDLDLIYRETSGVLNPRAFIERKHEYRKTIVKKGASIGANATIVCGITIGEYALIGAGSVITRDVPDYALVYGNPAREWGKVDREGCKVCEQKFD